MLTVKLVNRQHMRFVPYKNLDLNLKMEKKFFTEFLILEEVPLILILAYGLVQKENDMITLLRILEQVEMNI